MMDQQKTMAMAALITRRRDLLARILKASIEQERAITEGLVEQLVARLNDKQLLIDQMRAVQEQLKPWAKFQPEDRCWPDEQSRQVCRQEITETERLQQAVLEIDARCEKVMLERRDEIFESLNKTTGAATVAKAYGGSASSRPKGGSIDLSSG